LTRHATGGRLIDTATGEIIVDWRAVSRERAAPAQGELKWPACAVIDYGRLIVCQSAARARADQKGEPPDPFWDWIVPVPTSAGGP
jgi:hypothetical protein